MSRHRRSGSWICPSTRWALYLRDKLTCTYCRKGIEGVLSDSDFLTLDHLSLDPADMSDPNLLMTCQGI